MDGQFHDYFKFRNFKDKGNNVFLKTQHHKSNPLLVAVKLFICS